mgnify:CR=1 FL=1
MAEGENVTHFLSRIQEEMSDPSYSVPMKQLEKDIAKMPAIPDYSRVPEERNMDFSDIPLLLRKYFP